MSATKVDELNPAERSQLEAAQNKISRDINAARHNGVTGKPNSASSQRMQADVARNVNQEKRIEAGIQNGSITNHEVAKLESGQARVTSKGSACRSRRSRLWPSKAGIQRSENHQSKRIHREKHDAQTRG